MLNQLFQNVLLALLKTYKKWFSPTQLPSCRYTPTCSEYASEAIVRHGALRGFAMSLWRLMRCHPFVRGGYDPVPMPRDVQARAAIEAHGGGH